MNYSRPPLSKSPTPSKSSMGSAFPHLPQSASRAHTPNSITERLGFLSSDKSEYEIIDKYKLKEIR